MKIIQEKGKRMPDDDLIHHWEMEITAFLGNIERAKKRVINEKTKK